MGFLFLVLYPLLPPPPAYPPNPPTHNIIKHHIQYITLKHSHVITHTRHHSHTRITHTHHSHTHILQTISSKHRIEYITHTHHQASHPIHHFHTHHSHTHHSLTRIILSHTHHGNNIIRASHPIHHSHAPSSITSNTSLRPVSLLASLGLRRSAGGFCVAGAGLGALQRDRMYALASLWRPLVSAALPVAFVWQVQDLVHCKGVGCTPWRPSGVPWSPLLCRWLLCGRCGTWWIARGRMYALASLWRPLVSAALPVAFVWQVRDLVHCKGVGCTPGPLCPGVPLATNHWKNTVFRDFPTFSRTWIVFLLRLSLL